MIVLQLKSIDPNGKDASPADASATVKKVLGAIDVPLIVWGVANLEKDEEVLKKIAEDCQDVQLTIGPVEDKNHKGIGAAAMGYGHTIITSSPIDVNLAKQVNILLENLGMPMDRVIIDPTTGGLGYGLEYSYSVMERLRMAAMAQGDDKLQLPIINNLGNEIWKCKEAKLTADEAPTLGDPEKRGILMEAVGAVTYLMAGSDILIMRHPEAIRLVKAFIDLAMDGGSAADVAPIAKRLEDVNVDLAALAPAPDLTIEDEKESRSGQSRRGAQGCRQTGRQAGRRTAAKPAAAKKAEPAPAAAPAAPAVDAASRSQGQSRGRSRRQGQSRSGSQGQGRSGSQSQGGCRSQGQSSRGSQSQGGEGSRGQGSRRKRRRRRGPAPEACRGARQDGCRTQNRRRDKVVPMTPAAEQKSEPEKILERLDWVHKRVSLY